MLLDFLVDQNRYIGLISIVGILGIAFLCSNAKRRVNIKLVINALLMQVALAFFILKTGVGKAIFSGLAHGFESLYYFADKGSQFVFGSLTDVSGPWGMVFAFKVLPNMIFFGAIMAVLYHFGVVQILVRAMAVVMRPILGISGAETLCVAASSMLSQTEAPLLIKNYLARMTDSEIFLVMVCGMAHLSGSILAVYGSMGVPLEHLLTSSMIAIPSSILIAKIMMPEVAVPETAGGNFKVVPAETRNVLDAVSSGTHDGLRLAVGVGAMLIAIIGLMALFDYLLLASTGGIFGWLRAYGFNLPEVGFSLNDFFGKSFYWIAYAIGIPMSDCAAAGVLLGKKLAINEFVAYADFAGRDLLPRTRIIMTYALSGFANFSSIGIQIGGIGAVCPEKRVKLTQLGLKALLGGTLVNLLNATLIGLLI